MPRGAGGDLDGMKLRALQAKATELGVDDAKLDDAEDKAQVIALIVAIGACMTKTQKPRSQEIPVRNLDVPKSAV